MENHGGKRQGSGRPKGAKGKKGSKAKRILEEARKEGITPLDYMLSVLRDENSTPEERMEAARNSAPYVHSKLSSVDANVNFNQHEQALDDLEREEDQEES